MYTYQHTYKKPCSNRTYHYTLYIAYKVEVHHIANTYKYRDITLVRQRKVHMLILSFIIM